MYVCMCVASAEGVPQAAVNLYVYVFVGFFNRHLLYTHTHHCINHVSLIAESLR